MIIPLWQGFPVQATFMTLWGEKFNTLKLMVFFAFKVIKLPLIKGNNTNNDFYAKKERSSRGMKSDENRPYTAPKAYYNPGLPYII